MTEDNSQVCESETDESLIDEINKFITDNREWVVDRMLKTNTLFQRLHKPEAKA